MKTVEAVSTKDSFCESLRLRRTLDFSPARQGYTVFYLRVCRLAVFTAS